MKYLSTVIVVAVTLAFMKYLGASSKKQPEANREGVLILKMNQAYGIVGYIGIAFSVAIGIIASLGTVKSIQDLIVVIILVLFILSLSMPLILVSKKSKIEVDGEKIKHFGISGKIKTIYWVEIKKVKFSRSMMELSFITDKSKIKAHMHMIGFFELVNIMKAKIDHSIYKDAINLIENTDRAI